MITHNSRNKCSIMYHLFLPVDQLICNNTLASASGSTTFYKLREGSEYCYKYFHSSVNFFEANRTCIRENALLLRIDSKIENDYIKKTFPNDTSFWIGLTDLDTEGVFKFVTFCKNIVSVNSIQF